MDNINELLRQDETASYDTEDSMTLLEEETQRIPADLREKVMQGEYIV